MYTLSKILTL